MHVSVHDECAPRETVRTVGSATIQSRDMEGQSRVDIVEYLSMHPSSVLPTSGKVVDSRLPEHTGNDTEVPSHGRRKGTIVSGVTEGCTVPSFGVVDQSRVR